jgi:hypothetical protein
MSLDIKTALARTEGVIRLAIIDAYNQGVLDGANREATKLLPADVMAGYEKLIAEFQESGDHETAGVLLSIFSDLRKHVTISPVEILTDEQAKEIWERTP